jgi:hypothetical protein
LRLQRPGEKFNLRLEALKARRRETAFETKFFALTLTRKAVAPSAANKKLLTCSRACSTYVGMRALSFVTGHSFPRGGELSF